MSAAGQQDAKRDRILQSLRRIAHLDVSDQLGPVRQFGDGWRYRHRVRLHAAWERGCWRLGYYGRRSHSLVPLGACPVLWPELERDAGQLARAIKTISRQVELREVEIAHSRRDGRTAARMIVEGAQRLLREDLGWFDRSGLSGVEVIGPEGSWRHGNLELRYDHARADQFDLKFEPSTFTQARPEANDQLVNSVLTAVRPRHGVRVLELYAGIGNFSVPIAFGGAAVVAVEVNARSALLGRRNARRVGMHMRVLEAADEAALAGGELGPLAEFDCVLMDPPRTGARAVATALAAEGPGRVVYVSCDPATLARDAGILVEGGYHLSRVEAFDMFPQTPHVEVLAVFRRSEDEGAPESGTGVP